MLVIMAGGGASSALWLPRGATVIMIAPSDVKDDYVMWNHMAHLHVRWMEITDFNQDAEVFPMEEVAHLAEEAVNKYKDEHDCEMDN